MFRHDIGQHLRTVDLEINLIFTITLSIRKKAKQYLLVPDGATEPFRTYRFCFAVLRESTVP